MNTQMNEFECPSPNNTTYVFSLGTWTAGPARLPSNRRPWTTTATTIWRTSTIITITITRITTRRWWRITITAPRPIETNPPLRITARSRRRPSGGNETPPPERRGETTGPDGAAAAAARRRRVDRRRVVVFGVYRADVIVAPRRRRSSRRDGPRPDVFFFFFLYIILNNI